MIQKNFSADLGLVGGALGDDLPPLPRHQVEQLVHQERRRHRLHAAPGDRDQLAADGTPEQNADP